MKLTRIHDHEWTMDYSQMHSLTCINHPTARYLTKHPFHRGIHVIRLPEGDIERDPYTGECTCPLSDLALIERDPFVSGISIRFDTHDGPWLDGTQRSFTRRINGSEFRFQRVSYRDGRARIYVYRIEVDECGETNYIRIHKFSS